MNFKRLLATVICAMMLLTSVAFAEQVDLPDTYTHATDASSKEVLSGEQMANPSSPNHSHCRGVSTSSQAARAEVIRLSLIHI